MQWLILALSLPHQPASLFAGDHAQAHTTASAMVFRSQGGFLLTMVAAGQQMIPGTAKCQGAVDRFQERALRQMRCKLNLSMAFLINWN